MAKITLPADGMGIKLIFFQAIQLFYRYPSLRSREHRDKRKNTFPGENEKHRQ